MDDLYQSYVKAKTVHLEILSTVMGDLGKKQKH